MFDNKLGRRFFGEYAEQYTHDGDSCGIHSSGASLSTEGHVVEPAYQVLMHVVEQASCRIKLVGSSQGLCD